MNRTAAPRPVRCAASNRAVGHGTSEALVRAELGCHGRARASWLYGHRRYVDPKATDATPSVSAGAPGGEADTGTLPGVPRRGRGHGAGRLLADGEARRYGGKRRAAALRCHSPAQNACCVGEVVSEPGASVVPGAAPSVSHRTAHPSVGPPMHAVAAGPGPRTGCAPSHARHNIISRWPRVDLKGCVSGRCCTGSRNRARRGVPGRASVTHGLREGP